MGNSDLETNVEYIVHSINELKQGISPLIEKKPTSFEEDILAIQENKAFIVDKWNEHKKVKPEDISAINNITNIFETSFLNVVGDAFPEVIGGILGFLQGASGKDYYSEAMNNIEARLGKYAQNQKPSSVEEAQKDIQKYLVPEEHIYCGGHKFDIYQGKIDLSGVDPEYAFTKENIIRAGIESQSQTQKAIIDLYKIKNGELYERRNKQSKAI